MKGWLLCAYVTGASMMLGCTLDDRVLHGSTAAGGQSAGFPAQYSAGGAAEGGRTDGGFGPSDAAVADADSAAAGGAGGGPVEALPLVDGCADLDTDGISDCLETRAVNPDFDRDVSSWNVVPIAGDSFMTALSWDDANAGGGDRSGSASVSVSGVIDFNGSTLRAASQCLSSTPTQLVIVYANAFIDSEQDPTGSAEVDVSFFDSADCSGTATSSFSTPQPDDATTGTWLTLHAGSLSGASTKSLLLQLEVVKPFRANSVRAKFDNILIKIQSP